MYHAFKRDLNLASITGGTDIISLFGAPSQISPVYEGEIQVRGLGMAVEAWNSAGQDVSDLGEPGDLVCTKPFPCQPVMFWGSDGEERYRDSYFSTFKGIWKHGDFIRINPLTGGIAMLGRSDGVLKPSGVRFGSAEIYSILLKHFPEIEDGLGVGRQRDSEADEKVVLFVKMSKGHEMTEDLKDSIRDKIKADLSIRHVPSVIDEVCYSRSVDAERYVTVEID